MPPAKYANLYKFALLANLQILNTKSQAFFEDLNDFLTVGNMIPAIQC